MDRAKTITQVITMIAVFLCCLLIADAQTSEEPSPENSKKDSEEECTLDFFTNGDDNFQSFNFMFKRPFKLKRIEGSLSGKYFLTFQKPDLPEDISLWDSLRREFSEMDAVSESFALRLEGNTPHKFAAGGYIEVEGDFSIDTDPHLHVSVYGEYAPYGFVKVALGSWAEVLRLRKEAREDGRYRSGLRAHIEIEWKKFSMMIECLPHWGFRKYRVNASPEFEIKIRDSWSFILHGEIDYSSENKDLTVEPLVDIIKPLEIRWTQLIRYTF